MYIYAAKEARISRLVSFIEALPTSVSLFALPIYLPPCEFFLFLIILNNILILTRLPFYLHGIARLVAPSILARQLASVAPVRVARQACHAGAATWTCATWALTCSALSRHMRWRHKSCRAVRAGATRIISWARASPFSPTPPFFHLFLPIAPPPERPPPTSPPRSPPNPAFWRG